MAINYFGEARMKQLLTLIKGQLDLKATPAQIAQAIEDANLSQYALSVDLTALANKVGEIPEGYAEETVIAYINKKAEETLASATGGSSESAASVLAALNTYKAENDPKVKANTDAIAKLNGDAETEGSVAKQVADEAAARSAADTALGDRIKAVEDDYLKAADKTELEGKIEAAVKAHDESDAAHATLFKALNDKDTALQGEIDAMEGKVGTVPENKTVVEMIADAQTAATYDDTQVKADIKANKDAIDVLNGSGEGSVDKKIDDAFNDFATKVSDDGVVNSYKELIDWAAEHGGDAAEMAAAITKLEAIVDGIGGEGEKATVVAYVTDAIEALKIGDYAKATELAALADRVTALEGKSHEHDNKAVLDGITQAMVDAWNTADTEYTETEVTAMWNSVFGAEA